MGSYGSFQIIHPMGKSRFLKYLLPSHEWKATKYVSFTINPFPKISHSSLLSSLDW
jgi:hypothetical protein